MNSIKRFCSIFDDQDFNFNQNQWANEKAIVEMEKSSWVALQFGFAYNFHLLKNQYVFLNYPLKSHWDDDDDTVIYSRYKRTQCWQIAPSERRWKSCLQIKIDGEKNDIHWKLSESPMKQRRQRRQLIEGNEMHAVWLTRTTLQMKIIMKREQEPILASNGKIKRAIQNLNRGDILRTWNKYTTEANTKQQHT